MGCTRAVGITFAQAIEDLLEFVAPRDDNAGTDRAQLEKNPKVIEVAVVERILVVPFDLKGDSVFETVNFVGRVRTAFPVDPNFRVEFFLIPATLLEFFVKKARYQGFSATRRRYLAFL